MNFTQCTLNTLNVTVAIRELNLSTNGTTKQQSYIPDQMIR
jgi:hypothetical protein